MATAKVVYDLFVSYETNSCEIFIHHHISVCHSHAILRAILYQFVLAIAATV